MQSPSELLTINHPSVISAYIKHGIGAQEANVLVIETDIDIKHIDMTDEKCEGAECERYLELLADLRDIRRSVETKYGDLARVDIKSVTLH